MSRASMRTTPSVLLGKNTLRNTDLLSTMLPPLAPSPTPAEHLAVVAPLQSTALGVVFPANSYAAPLASKHFAFCLIWVFGAGLDTHSREKYNGFLLKLFSQDEAANASRTNLAPVASADRLQLLRDVEFPPTQSVFDVAVCDRANPPAWERWVVRLSAATQLVGAQLTSAAAPSPVVPRFSAPGQKSVVNRSLHRHAALASLVVPTPESLAHASYLRSLLQLGRDVLLVGPPSCGKNALVEQAVAARSPATGKALQPDEFRERPYTARICITARSTSADVRTQLLHRLNPRSSTEYGPPGSVPGVVVLSGLDLAGAAAPAAPADTAPFAAHDTVDLLRELAERRAFYQLSMALAPKLLPRRRHFATVLRRCPPN
jgi:hypothetical protein